MAKLEILNPEYCTSQNLRKAARTAARLYDQALQPLGLKTTQFTLLAKIQGAGEIAQNELANNVGLDKTTMSRNLRLLEKDALVRIAEAEDRRIRLLSLSRKGERLLEKAKPLWRMAQSSFVDELGVDAWQTLTAILQTIEPVENR
jgi:DNA-binding MarR family transcriptional regulator